MIDITPTTLLLYLLAVIATLAAAVIDTRTGRIPNWLTLPLLLLGPVVAFVGGGKMELLRALLGILLCSLLPLLLFVRGAMGGGDVKLLAALGGLLGPYSGIEVQLASYLLLTTFIFAMMAWRGQLFRTLKNALLAGGNLVLPQRYQQTLDPATLTNVRMGFAIFLATALCIFRLTVR